MKLTLMIATVIGVTGCASSAPKEELKNIFNLVQDHKYIEAQDLFKSIAGGTATGDFATYTGVIIPAVNSPNHDDVKSLLAGAKEHLESCNEQLDEAKGLSINNSEEDDLRERFRVVQEDFKSHCTGRAKKDYSQVAKIKLYSTVDLFPQIKGYESDFKKEVGRIRFEISDQSKNADQAVAEREEKKNDYENSAPYYSKKLCETVSDIKYANEIIAKENEASKISGFVNKHKMYAAGQAITTKRQRIEHYSAEYLTKFGKTWDESECNLVANK